jgi:hypothetical protein
VHVHKLSAMPSPASHTASMVLLLLTLIPSVAAENLGMKATITNAFCSDGIMLNEYSIECLDDNGEETACGFGRSANINANGTLVVLRNSQPCYKDFISFFFSFSTTSFTMDLMN